MSTKFAISAPSDYLLARDVCSYGYFLLEPNYWNPADRSLRRVLNVADGAVSLCITQSGTRRGSPLRIRADRAPSRAEKVEVRGQVSRMLRLDEDHECIRVFHRLDPRWRRSGRGRLFRSPTFFEDVIKTVTSCNVTWPSTVSMNRRLCEAFGGVSASGGRAFPIPQAIASQRPAALRGRCGVGYRDARIVELARMFVEGRIDPTRLASGAMADEQVRDEVLEWPGIGPYAAANLLQLLGRYAHLPLDTESVRHGRTVLKMKGPSRSIMKRIDAHFSPFGEQRFRSYWFELWDFYEAKRGKSWTWEAQTTGKTFTAARLKAAAKKLG